MTWPSRYIDPESQRDVRTRVQKKVVPVAASVLPFDAAGSAEAGAITQLNEWIEREAKAGKMLFRDTNKAVRDTSHPRLLASSPDGLHPDPAGYRRVGEALSAALVSAGF